MGGWGTDAYRGIGSVCKVCKYRNGADLVDIQCWSLFLSSVLTGRGSRVDAK